MIVQPELSAFQQCIPCALQETDGIPVMGRLGGSGDKLGGESTEAARRLDGGRGDEGL